MKKHPPHQRRLAREPKKRTAAQGTAELGKNLHDRRLAYHNGKQKLTELQM